jgi:hypothetical protein
VEEDPVVQRKNWYVSLSQGDLRRAVAAHGEGMTVPTLAPRAGKSVLAQHGPEARCGRGPLEIQTSSDPRGSYSARGSCFEPARLPQRNLEEQHRHGNTGKGPLGLSATDSEDRSGLRQHGHRNLGQLALPAELSIQQPFSSVE